MDEKRKKQARVKDLDSEIGFWLRGAVYVWVPGDTPETCHRYYLFHGRNDDYFLFTDDNSPLPGSGVKNIEPLGRKPLTPSFSLFPFKISDHPDCRIVRNCFSVWVYNMNIFDVGEPRMEGIRLSTWGSIEILNTFTIINPKTKYTKEIRLKNVYLSIINNEGEVVEEDKTILGSSEFEYTAEDDEDESELDYYDEDEYTAEDDEDESDLDYYDEDESEY